MSYDAPPPPTPSPYGGVPQPAPSNTPAIWSLVLGFVSIPLTCLCGLGVILGLAAIVVLLTVLLVLYATGAIQNPRSS